MGALLEAQHQGIIVPDAISVVGFDDLALSSHFQPALTTMHVPSKAMGERAADYLLARLEHEAVQECHELEAKLVVRATTAKPQKKSPINRGFFIGITKSNLCLYWVFVFGLGLYRHQTKLLRVSSTVTSY
nr:substrate-binding domain-containing protein [Enterovibrio nigricans]